MSSKPGTSKREGSARTMAASEIILTRNKSNQMKRVLRNTDKSRKRITQITNLLRSPSCEKDPPKFNKKSKVATQVQSKQTNSKRELTQKEQKTVSKEIVKKKSNSKTEKHHTGKPLYFVEKKYAYLLKKVGEEEFHPEKKKRRRRRTKMVLKPASGQRIIGNKRKMTIPQKDTSSIPSKRPCSGVTEYKTEDQELSRLGTEDHHRPVSPSSDAVMELESLTDEDLLEILTCESPVWWEEPPNEEYTEEPISYTKVKTEKTYEDEAKAHIIDCPEVKETSTKQTEILGISQTREFDNKFLKKRSKLEKLLGNIKNKIDDKQETPKNTGKVEQSKINDDSSKLIDKPGVRNDTELNIADNESKNVNIQHDSNPDKLSDNKSNIKASETEKNYKTMPEASYDESKHVNILKVDSNLDQLSENKLEITASQTEKKEKTLSESSNDESKHVTHVNVDSNSDKPSDNKSKIEPSQTEKQDKSLSENSGIDNVSLHLCYDEMFENFENIEIPVESCKKLCEETIVIEDDSPKKVAAGQLDKKKDLEVTEIYPDKNNAGDDIMEQVLVSKEIQLPISPSGAHLRITSIQESSSPISIRSSILSDATDSINASNVDILDTISDTNIKFVDEDCDSSGRNSVVEEIVVTYKEITTNAHENISQSENEIINLVEENTAKVTENIYESSKETIIMLEETPAYASKNKEHSEKTLIDSVEENTLRLNKNIEESEKEILALVEEHTAGLVKENSPELHKSIEKSEKEILALVEEHTAGLDKTIDESKKKANATIKEQPKVTETIDDNKIEVSATVNEKITNTFIDRKSTMFRLKQAYKELCNKKDSAQLSKLQNDEKCIDQHNVQHIKKPNFETNEKNKNIASFKEKSDNTKPNERRSLLKISEPDTITPIKTIIDTNNIKEMISNNLKIDQNDGEKTKINSFYKKCKNSQRRCKYTIVTSCKTNTNTETLEETPKCTKVIESKAADALVTEDDKTKSACNNCTEEDKLSKTCDTEKASDKASIVVSNSAIKYCLKCSSIFDTDNCGYCLKKTNNFNKNDKSNNCNKRAT